MSKKKLILATFLLLISFAHFALDDDVYKLFLSGISSTYNIELSKNNIGLFIAIVIVGITFLIKKSKIKTYVLVLLLTLWGCSLITKAIDYEQKRCIYGILFVKIYEAPLD